MSLSRLQGFLQSPRGTVFYVDVNALDATDSIENRGTSATRPFRTIARAIAEVARYSYQRGVDNDRFAKSTILVSPGTYLIDNRPGAVVKNDGSLVLRSGAVTSISQWDIISNFDESFVDNDLYKLNSVYGGLIVPRGCSIIGADLRKVKIVPLYVPNPENEDIERSAIFRLTGASFLYGFSILDSDPNGNCYKDYTKNKFVPNFSHHKLTAFEYADGVNPVIIDDEFQSVNTNFTDLDMFYDKIARVYGDSSGRPIGDATYGVNGIIDIEPIVDEYRIVGSRGKEVGITSIRSGDGNLNPSTTITVTIEEEISDLSVDSPIEISGVGFEGYNGQFVIFNVINSTEFEYKVQNVPLNPLPGVLGATLNLTVDTVTSASPYIFNVSLRSVYGMCGLHADGSKADGFKSMVVAQFTGIGLQKDDNAFVIYDNVSGAYRDSTIIQDLHTNSRARFKPEYENYHIKASNNAFLQLVSIFAIGYAQHFLAESGADYSITNSNSNFGAKSLVASGFRDEAFQKDDVGYITHIIPPQELETEDSSIEFLSIDVGLTTSRSAGAATTTRLYLYQQDNIDESPISVIDGYRIGAKQNELLSIQINQLGITSEFSSSIVMPGTESSSEKSVGVAKTTGGENDIDLNSIITLVEDHNFENGETVRIFSDDGHLPDGLQNNQIYFVITKESIISLGTNQIKLAQTLNSAILGESINFNSKGGNLSIVSRVSDKFPGDIGHPIQWDTIGNWYINVSSTSNQIYDQILLGGTSSLGQATSRTYVLRKPDTRNLLDTLYRFRYVIPKDSPITARPPIEGYIIQEPSTTITLDDVQKYFSDSSVTFTTSTELRNLRFISDAVWNSNSVTITTELPHNLRVGTEVKIENIIPSGYNGDYIVTEILNSRQFKYALDVNPGAFNTNTSVRNEELPTFKKKTLPGTYHVYRVQEIHRYVPNEQDGIYHLIVTNSSNSPTVTPFRQLRFNQPIQNLYPQANRDNPISDPNPTRSFALPDPIGQVVVDNPEHSLSKETLEQTIQDFNIGLGVTSIVSNQTGISHTIFTSIDHGLSAINGVSIINGGSNYIEGIYYGANVVGFAGSTVGSNASVKVTVGGAGTITSVEIMDGGSAYGIGNTLSVIPSAGIGTTSGFVAGIIQVTSVSDSLNDSLSISGLAGTFTGYNTVYRVTAIEDAKAIQVQSSSAVIGFASSVGHTVLQNSSIVKTGKALQISSFSYDSNIGIATIGFSTSHGLLVNNKIRLGGFNESFFNKDVIVKRQNSLISAVVHVGKGGVGLSTAGTLYAYRNGYSSNAGIVSPEHENIGGRLIFEYGGITSNITAQLLIGSTTDQLVINNAVELGFKLGDYLQINNEVFRIKTTVTSDTVNVFRSLFGSYRESHDLGSVVRRINVTPIELRRNSIIRASGHTFEYVGFGPGNYSTAFPERQDRILSPQEELIAQSSKQNGGIVNFTAMNSDGDFYTGNRKVNSSTGQEEVFDVPVPTIRGEEIDTNSGFDIMTPMEVSISRSLRVEGGFDKNLISEFDGPVVFNHKVTSTSDSGIEASSFFIQGDEILSRKFSVSKEIPSFAGNYGDINFNTEPNKDGFVGWAYVTENRWEPFGFIGRPGVGISSAGEYIGFSTLINVVASGMTFTVDFDSATGISTLTWEADPRIGIFTGLNATNFLGNVTKLNFVGGGVTVTGNTQTGIATIVLDKALITGSSPGEPYNSFQWNDNDTFGGQNVMYFDQNLNQVRFGSFTNISESIFFNNFGSVGFGSTLPTSKVEIIADNERSIHIKSTSGSEIVRVENTTNDTTPFIIDQNGSVGINTDFIIAPLDVVGDVAITGITKLYQLDRINYVGFQVGSLSSNLTFTLPNSYGSNEYGLRTNGDGLLYWGFVSSEVTAAGPGINISKATSGGITTATISNSGVTKVIAGEGIVVTPEQGTGDITISVQMEEMGPPNIYPFTTRGFSIPV